jgi:hypothetical protein
MCWVSDGPNARSSLKAWIGERVKEFHLDETNKRGAGDPRKSPASSQLVSPIEVPASEVGEYSLRLDWLQVFLQCMQAARTMDYVHNGKSANF